MYITKNINLHRSHIFAKFTLKNCRAVQKQVVDDLRNIIKKLKEEEEEEKKQKKKQYKTIWYSTTNKHDFVSEYCQGSHIKTSVFRSVVAAYCGSARTTPRCISSLNVTEFALVIQTPCVAMLICKYCRIMHLFFFLPFLWLLWLHKVTTTSQSLSLSLFLSQQPNGLLQECSKKKISLRQSFLKRFFLCVCIFFVFVLTADCCLTGRSQEKSPPPW